MKLTGGCYCGAVRHKVEGQPLMQAQCHSRECQYITGGSPNMFFAYLPKPALIEGRSPAAGRARRLKPLKAEQGPRVSIEHR